MGHQTALSIAESGLSLRDQLVWHLTSNHYPPIPTTMVEPCVMAINLASNGDWDARVELPEGVSYRGEVTAPVSAIIEQHHLDAFVIDDEEYFG